MSSRLKDRNDWQILSQLLLLRLLFSSPTLFVLDSNLVLRLK